MQRDKILAAAGLLAAAVLIVLLLPDRHQNEPSARRHGAVTVVPRAAGSRTVPAQAEPTAVPEPAHAGEALPAPGQANEALPSRTQPQATATTPSPADRDPPATDHLARAALAFVGLDADAEEYWAEAINNANLPSEERRNLIEDLNEDGLPDPRHPTTQDLPLIVSRLELIEEMAPDAMDQVNEEAFAEAHKDLRNIYQRLTGQSWPEFP